MVKAKTMAKIRQAEIARKSQAQKLQSSGYVPSQLGHLTSEQRLIDNGHYMRSSTQLNSDRLKRQIERIKNEIDNREVRVVTVKKV